MEVAEISAANPPLPTPDPEASARILCSRFSLLGFPLPHLTKSQHAQFVEPYGVIIRSLKIKTPGAELIDQLPFLLSPEDTVSYIDPDGALLYRDQHHLTKRGAMRLLPAFRAAISRQNQKPKNTD